MSQAPIGISADRSLLTPHEGTHLMTRIRVNTYIMGNSETILESSHVIDHDSIGNRKWLGKHCFWAMRHGRKVETYPIAI